MLLSLMEKYESAVQRQTAETIEPVSLFTWFHFLSGASRLAHRSEPELQSENIGSSLSQHTQMTNKIF